MSPNATIQEIKDLIGLLVKEGLADHQQMPSISRVGRASYIGIPGSPDLSVSLKNEPYTLVYDELRKAGAYHIRMIDGALIQMLYSFEGRALTAHRLAMFPSPALEMYDSIPEDYDTEAWYTDIIGEFSVKVPLRFDFSASDTEHVDVEHPKSHLTIGQYKGCRIPVSSPLTPKRFMRFVLRNFYNPAYFAVDIDAEANASAFPESITTREKAIGHVMS